MKALFQAAQHMKSKGFILKCIFSTSCTRDVSCCLCWGLTCLVSYTAESKRCRNSTCVKLSVTMLKITSGSRCLGLFLTKLVGLLSWVLLAKDPCIIFFLSDDFLTAVVLITINNQAQTRGPSFWVFLHGYVTCDWFIFKKTNFSQEGQFICRLPHPQFHNNT